MDRKQAKYTPGPWRVGGHPGDSSGTGWRVVLSDGGTFKGAYVCQALEQDAHPIALAPRMVDALRVALPMLEELETWEWGNGGAEVLPEAEEVRAILREIDGEEE